MPHKQQEQELEEWPDEGDEFVSYLHGLIDWATTEFTFPPKSERLEPVKESLEKDDISQFVTLAFS